MQGETAKSLGKHGAAVCRGQRRALTDNAHLYKNLLTIFQNGDIINSKLRALFSGESDKERNEYRKWTQGVVGTQDTRDVYTP